MGRKEQAQYLVIADSYTCKPCSVFILIRESACAVLRGSRNVVADINGALFYILWQFLAKYIWGNPASNQTMVNLGGHFRYPPESNFYFKEVGSEFTFQLGVLFAILFGVPLGFPFGVPLVIYLVCHLVYNLLCHLVSKIPSQVILFFVVKDSFHLIICFHAKI
jgi:hypothetical protein